MTSPLATSPSPDSSPPSAAAGGGLVACVLFAVLGVLAGVATGAIAPRTSNVFGIPEEHTRDLPSPVPADVAQKLGGFQRIADQKNNALTHALGGLLIAGGVLLAGRLAGQRRGAAAVLVGLVLATALGAAGGWLEAVLSNRIRTRPDLDPMIQTIVLHGVSWGYTGLGVGLAASVLWSGPMGCLRAAVAGLLGGALAATAFTVGVSNFFPMAKLDQAIPEGIRDQLLWGGLAGLLISVLVWRASSVRPAATATPAPAA